MRLLPLSLIAIFIGGCSCQRAPVAPERVVAPAEAPATNAISTESEAEAPAESMQVAPTPPGLSSGDAASTVHSYVHALMQAGGGDSNSYWVGGHAPPRPDDAVLRALIPDIRNLRINNDAAIPLDKEQPPQALEVPVHLRIRTDTGTRHLRGWYRLRPRIDGSGWEITSASLQPVLD